VQAKNILQKKWRFHCKKQGHLNTGHLTIKSPKKKSNKAREKYKAKVIDKEEANNY
jgi:hypothetical protein